MKLKYIYIIGFFTLLIFNVFNINYPDFRLYGMFVISTILTLLGLHYKYKTVIGIVTWAVLTDLVLRLLIDFVGNFNVITETGESVSVLIQLLAQIMVLVISLIIVSVVYAFKILIKRK